jgi:hypothetical protein
MAQVSFASVLEVPPSRQMTSDMNILIILAEAFISVGIAYGQCDTATDQVYVLFSIGLNNFLFPLTPSVVMFSVYSQGIVAVQPIDCIRRLPFKKVSQCMGAMTMRITFSADMIDKYRTTDASLSG